MSVRISNLTEGTPSSSDYIVFDGTNGTKKAPYSLIEDKADRADVLPLINIWDEQWELGTINTSTGADITYGDSIRTVGFIKVNPSTKYYVKISDGHTFTLYYYNANKGYISPLGLNNGSQEITTPSSCYYMRFVVGTTQSYANNVSINYPSTYHGYYPSRLAKAESNIGNLGNVIGMRGWNQLAKNGNFASDAGWEIYNGGSFSVTNNECTVTGVDSGTIVFTRLSLNTTHKYYCCVTAKLNSGSRAGLFLGGGSPVGTNEIGKWILLEKIFTGSSETWWGCSCSGGVAIFKNFMLIDLTANGLDYINSVADFRAMFPAEYYPYCSGGFGDLLWENASPSSVFGAQTINLDLSKYRFVVIYALRDKNNATAGYSCTTFGLVGRSNQIIQYATECSRAFDATNSGISFARGVYNSSFTDDYAIPYQIYGVR